MTTRLRKNGGVHQLIFVVLAALWLTVGARRVSATDWLMYGFNLQRTGENPFESILTPSTYGAVNISNGVAYAETASYCDLTPYHGKIVALKIATHTVMGTFFPAGPRTNGGGIWGPGGISIDPATGDVFTATGNALTNPESFRYSENVVELSSVLQVLGSNYPGLTGLDVDFGATPILYQPPGCSPMVAAKNKSGVLVTYERGNVSVGPTQRLQVANVSDWQFNGIPAWSDTTHLLYIGNSSDSNSGGFMHC